MKFQLICDWLSEEQTVKFLTNMDEKLYELQKSQTYLNVVQDSLYFIHRSLYDRRPRELNTKIASDILSRKSYDYLPLSIFLPPREDRKKSELSAYYTRDEKIDIDHLMREIDIAIRAKLAFSESFPLNANIKRLQHGILSIGINNFFELVLTLDHSDRKSRWKLLDFSLKTISHPDEVMRETSHYKILQNEILENKIFNVLHRISRIDVDAINNDCTESNSDGISSSNTNQMNVLHHMWAVCCHASLMYMLRLFYIQGLEAVRTRGSMVSPRANKYFSHISVN
jgi:hypothetical protein